MVRSVPGLATCVNTEEVPYDRRLGQKPRLSGQDVDALVAFLKTLTDKGMQ